jgi:disulfide bond formation protein DsbB
VLLALASLAAVGLALVSQHVFGMQPCPWCVLQRILFLAIAAVCLSGAALLGLLSRVALVPVSLAASLLALGGVAAALYQHFFAAQSQSCAYSFDDKLITHWGLDEALPSVFEVRASCADAAVSLLGLPYEFWSLLLFLALAAAALLALRRRA